MTTLQLVDEKYAWIVRPEEKLSCPATYVEVRLFLCKQICSILLTRLISMLPLYRNQSMGLSIANNFTGFYMMGTSI